MSERELRRREAPECTCIPLKPIVPWMSAVVRFDCPIHTDQLAEAELESRGLRSVTFVPGPGERSPAW